MREFGAILPMPPTIGQVSAEMHQPVFWRFANLAKRAKQPLATGCFSREPFAERQNRYPSPMQGPELIPVRPLYYSVGQSGWMKRLASARFLPDFGRETSQNKGLVGCVRKSPSSPVSAYLALRVAATPCWSKACSGRAQAHLVRQPLVATPRQARPSARVLTSSVRISRTPADISGGLTTCSNHYPGHPHAIRAGGFSFAKSHPGTGLRAALGTT